MEWLNYLVLALYIAMMVTIALYTRNRSKTLNDFLLAGKKGLGGWMSAFAYGTTYFSAVIFIGYAGNFGWSFGLAAIFIGIGNALLGSLLAWKVLARRTKVMTGMLGVKTMPELFEKRYHAKHIKLVAAVIMFVFLIPYSASVYQGLGYLFEIAFHIDFIWCVLIMATLTALYLVFGGYFATAMSDFIQGIIMVVGVIVMVAFTLNGIPQGAGAGFSELFESGLGLFPEVNGDGNFFNSNFFNLLVIVLLTSFGVWGLPQSVHKFYAVRDRKSVKQAMVVSTVFALVIGISAYLVGAVARFYYGGVKPDNADTIIPDILVRVLPAGLLGLIVVLVLSASMSTLSSLSLSGASAVSVDVYKGYIKKDAPDARVNLLMKLLCLLFVVVSVLLAVFKIDAIVTLMSLSWGTIAGCFIGPYVYGLYSKRVNKCGAYASLIAGLVVTFALILAFGFTTPGASGFWGVINAGIKRSPLIGVICMAVSMVVTPLFSLIKPREDHKEEDATLMDAVKNAKFE